MIEIREIIFNMKKKRTKFLVITYAPTIEKDNELCSYPPYVNEMEMWFEKVDEVRIISPFYYPEDVFLKPFKNSERIKRYHVPFVSFSNLKNTLLSLLYYPYIMLQLFRAMFWANHIHFRCPGSIPLVASLVQIGFPFTKKTVKYAGNWDPKSKQPLSYRIQKAILRNPYLSKNIKVLVYGEWPNQTKNVVPFMSATYTNDERIPYTKKDYKGILKFVFIGSLVVGKRPLYTIQIIEALLQQGVSCELHMYGDGNLKETVERYVNSKELADKVFVYGNQDKEVIKTAVQNAHFTILPSKSEGWPKAIAEGMFFGAIPISTRISCLEWILGQGARGILIDTDLESAVKEIMKALNEADLHSMSKEALDWAQQYTLDRLNLEMKKALEI